MIDNKIQDYEESVRVKLLLEKVTATIIVLIVVSTCVFILLKNKFEITHLIIWYVTFHLTTLLRVLIQYQFWKKIDTPAFNFKRWEMLYSLVVNSSAVIWSFALCYFYPENDPIVLALFLIISTGMVSGASAAYASSKKTIVPYMIILLLPLAIKVYSYGGFHNKLLSITLIVYITFMCKSIKTAHAFIMRTIHLSSDKEQLVREVTNVYRDLQNSHEKLIESQQKVVHSSRLAALGEMAAGIAHEVNNPLTTILNTAKKALRLSSNNKLTDADIIDLNNKIISNSSRIEKIVRSLKYFSRSEHMEKLQELEVKTIIQQTIDLCEEKFRSEGIDLQIEINTPETYLLINELQISQVIVNLLNNAFDVVKHIDEKWIKIYVKKDSKNIYINVANSGEKIPKEICDKIFDPFFTTKQSGEGTGLGLSISIQIIESHQGRLYIDKSQKNTTFVVSLPHIGMAQIKDKTA